VLTIPHICVPADGPTTHRASLTQAHRRLGRGGGRIHARVRPGTAWGGGGGGGGGAGAATGGGAGAGPGAGLGCDTTGHGMMACEGAV
jgi:hypothetical protein